MDLLAGLTGGYGCPAADDDHHAAQRRLLGVLLAGPLILAIAALQVLVPAFGQVATFAAVGALFVLAWLCVIVVAATGRGGGAGGVMLAGAALFAGVTIAGAGGMASPLALLAVCLVLETCWVGRSARAVQAGLAAGAVVLVVQASVPGSMFAAQPVTSGWHWLAPLVHLASLAVRLRSFSFQGAQRRQEQEQSLLEQALDAVVLRMSVDSDVVDVSQKARDLLGLQPELLLSNGLLERIHIADRIAWLGAIADLRAGEHRRVCEVRLRLPRQTDQPAADNYHAFVVELARPSGADEIIGLLRCNEEVAALRAALAEATETARDGEAARTRLLASVSHELRTPLNAIVGFSDMLTHGICGPLAARQEEYVQLIGEAGHHLLAVVNSILDVTRIESGAYTIHPEPFRVEEAVEMCRAMMALQAESRNIALTARVDAGLGEIVADKCSTRQILVNLLANAIKFTPEGGKVSLRATRLGSLLHISVADTGMGMAADDLARIGEPFTRIHNECTWRVEGSGLGLSVVKGLVGLHHGTMTVESAPGQGTTVTISLPVEGPDTGEVVAPAAEVLSPRIITEQEDDDGAFRKVA